MTENEFNSLHTMITELRESMSVDDFSEKVYKISDVSNPDGIFYSMKERMEYEQLLEQTNDKDIKQN
jgi:DNA-binding ferritin-like protein